MDQSSRLKDFNKAGPLKDGLFFWVNNYMQSHIHHRGGASNGNILHRFNKSRIGGIFQFRYKHIFSSCNLSPLCLCRFMHYHYSLMHPEIELKKFLLF